MIREGREGARRGDTETRRPGDRSERSFNLQSAICNRRQGDKETRRPGDQETSGTAEAAECGMGTMMNFEK